jgi:colanic acid/amylovoran biosynthesis protein
MQTILRNSDLVYARDMQSYRSLIELDGGDNVRISPDFTVLFEGERPEYFDAGLHQVCIVPNMRILDKRLDSGGYADLLGRIIACLQGNGLSPYFLIYGGDEDRELAEAINARASRPIPVVNETDPRHLKGLIGEALGLVGSRYHAIASGLYSGVVPVGFGWSHKYEQLYDDMGFPEGLIDLDVDKAGLERALQPIIDTHTRQLLRDKLLEKAEVQKQMVRQMFSEVRECLVSRI